MTRRVIFIGMLLITFFSSSSLALAAWSRPPSVLGLPVVSGGLTLALNTIVPNTNNKPMSTTSAAYKPCIGTTPWSMSDANDFVAISSNKCPAILTESSPKICFQQLSASPGDSAPTNTLACPLGYQAVLTFGTNVANNQPSTTPRYSPYLVYTDFYAVDPTTLDATKAAFYASNQFTCGPQSSGGAAVSGIVIGGDTSHNCSVPTCSDDYACSYIAGAGVILQTRQLPAGTAVPAGSTATVWQCVTNTQVSGPFCKSCNTVGSDCPLANSSCCGTWALIAGSGQRQVISCSYDFKPVTCSRSAGFWNPPPASPAYTLPPSSTVYSSTIVICGQLYNYWGLSNPTANQALGGQCVNTGTNQQ